METELLATLFKNGVVVKATQYLQKINIENASTGAVISIDKWIIKCF